MNMMLICLNNGYGSVQLLDGSEKTRTVYLFNLFEEAVIRVGKR